MFNSMSVVKCQSAGGKSIPTDRCIGLVLILLVLTPSQAEPTTTSVFEDTPRNLPALSSVTGLLARRRTLFCTLAPTLNGCDRSSVLLACRQVLSTMRATDRSANAYCCPSK
ncbi:hypothetical protein DFH06DRAFT_433808 [Mycena polygramma]|nr:hypothetical protein DFH06DRAFT_433808 [Mycena polygramma]